MCDLGANLPHESRTPGQNTTCDRRIAYLGACQRPEPPTAPKFSKLNTSSALNIDPRTSGMMSSRYRANDQYTQDYKKFLLDKYDFDVNQRNAKYQRRANMVSGIVNSIGFMGISAGANAYGQSVTRREQAKHNAMQKEVNSFIESLSPRSNLKESPSRFIELIFSKIL